MTSGSRKGGRPDAPRRGEIGPAVIDASIALKWVVPEPGSGAAAALYDRLEQAGVAVYVPDLFWSETASALWRLTRGREALLSPEEAHELFAALRTAPVRTDPVEPISAEALEIALATGATSYDAAYVALAELRDARLWTADRGLIGKLAGTDWEARATALNALE